MKKVWILEQFASIEEMRKTYEAVKAVRDNSNDVNQIAACNDVMAGQERLMAQYPNGRWTGWEGKADYKVFCSRAAQALRDFPKATFRVVEAIIDDDATSWIGYQAIKVNDSVMRYLMAVK